jgi:hypothetical protein
MDSQQKSGRLIDKADELKSNIHTYVRWRKLVLRAIRTRPHFISVLAYMQGDDQVMQEFQEEEEDPEEPNYRAVRDMNKERRDQERKFKANSAAVMSLLMESMSEQVISMIEQRPEYQEIYEEGDTRSFWGLIEGVISKANSTEAARVQSISYLESLKQNINEPFEVYAERSLRVVEEIEFMNSAITPEMQKKYFVKGFHPRHQKLKERMILDEDIQNMTIMDIAWKARNLMQAQKVYLDPPRALEYPDRNKRSDTVAGLNDRTSKDGDSGPKKQQKFLCYNCGEEGHFKRNCTKPPKEKPKNVGTVNKGGKKFSNQYLDTCATVSLTADKSSLSKLVRNKSTFRNANGIMQEYELEGYHPILGRTVYLEGAPMEIAAFSNVREKYKPIYSDESDAFFFENRETKNVDFVAKKSDRVYVISPTRNYVEPVEMISGMMSESGRKDGPMDLHRRTLHANHTVLRKSLRLGHYLDVVSGAIDDSAWEPVVNCIICKMYKDGRIRGQERGKDYSPHKVTFETMDKPERVYSLSVKIEAQVYFDLVYVGTDIYNLMLVKPHNYLLGMWVTKRDAETVLNSIVYLVTKVKAGAGIARVTSISVDREKAVHAIEQQLLIKTEAILKQAVPYKHERNIERQVRSARNRQRVIVGELKESGIPLTRKLRRLSWEHVVKGQNFVMNSNSGDFLPYQIQMASPNYRTPPRFGEFVVASVGKPVSKESERNGVGLLVGFEETTRAIMIKFKGQDQIVVRDAYSVINQEDGLKRYLEGYRDYDDEIDEEDEPVIEEELDSDALARILMANENDSMTQETTAPAAPTTETMDVEINATEPGETEQEEMEDTNEKEQTEDQAEENGPILRRSLRATKPNRLPDFIYALRELEKLESLPEPTLVSLERICGLIEDAAIQGEKGKRAAAMIELDRVWKKYGAIKPVTLEKNAAKEIIKGKLFVVEKKDSSHNFTRNKARLVARGDMRKEKPQEVLEVFSPTIAFPTFLTMLNIILQQKYDYMVVDVESAYLNSKYEEGIYMKLDAEIAKIMVEMDESVKKYIRDDGTLHVQILKALYGLQESAKLWYDTLGKSLTSIGFQRSNYDHACYFKRIGVDIVVILVYVDDMLIAGPEQEVQRVKSQLEKEYSINASEMSPREFDYVGIKVEYDERDHAFLLSQPGMVKKVTEGISVPSDVPCDVKLFVELDETKLEDVTDYRSKVMELNYLSKVRPDLKVALGYLATRMQDPTNGDWTKLERVRKYVYGTKEFKMRLKPMGSIKVYASADASFGPYKDGKSNTGLVLTVGHPNAPVLAKTTKQKSVANSSTAAELIAFSTTLEEVLWIIELLNELGFKQDAVEIEQDNSSTMRLIEKGPSSTGRTKWINIKHFWVSEHLKSGDIKLKYVPSLQLLADGLTKPLGRKAFFKWRASVLNHSVAQ